jgi:hypothetical protein
VVLRTLYPGSEAPAYLEAADGTSVPLKLRNSLADPFGCVAQMEFWAPESELAPHTAYTIKFHPPEPPVDDPESSYASTLFVTGDADDVELEASPISVSTFQIRNSKSCEDGAACPDFVEVRAGSQKLSGAPTWFIVSSAAGRQVGPLGAGALGSADRDELAPHEEFRSVVVPLARDECATYQRMDVHGDILEEGELCDYEKCVKGNPETLDCGGGPGTINIPLEEQWEKVGANSCRNPPNARLNASLSTWQIEAVPLDQGSAGSESGACSVRSPGLTLGASGVLFALFGLAAWVRLTRNRTSRLARPRRS